MRRRRGSDSAFPTNGRSGVRAIIPEKAPVAAQTPPQRADLCGFPALPPRRDHDRFTWRPLAHDTAKPGASSRSRPRSAAARGCSSGSVWPLAAVRSPLAGAADEGVTLNFVNADIEAVVKAVAEITGRNFVIDPKVKGTINIISARPVPREPRLPDPAVGAATAGVRGRRGRRRGQDRAGSRREAAGRRGRRRPGRRGWRPARHAGHHPQVRIRAAARQRAASADHAEQRDRRVPGQQRAGHHRLRRQPPADRPDHRVARPAARGRTDHRAGTLRVRDRHRRAPQSASRRYVRRRRRPLPPTASNA